MDNFIVATKNAGKIVFDPFSLRKCLFSPFEIGDNSLCPRSGWSQFLIFILIFICTFALYFFGGCLINRLKGAQGRNQIPHLAFWVWIGDGFANAANKFCRCHGFPEDDRKTVFFEIQLEWFWCFFSRNSTEILHGGFLVGASLHLVFWFVDQSERLIDIFVIKRNLSRKERKPFLDHKSQHTTKRFSRFSRSEIPLNSSLVETCKRP